ncbi:GrpB family protein [Niabella hibiscisoli]|uniref:GrpB family protein n=1 Tax=Niabella hibiscisoli TaxID=1825928 RepID=UPI001F0F8D3F|nr:GrpB family protein [Niabella hibiscisoli]MCH5720076.1 GrpB family protein [Niabella hibiscisoli]
MKFIEPYNPDWPVKFEQISQLLQTELEGVPIDIQHVGSTSIPGMLAKPILDIDIIIANKSSLDDIIDKLERIGYHYRGEQGINGRFAFRQTSAYTPVSEEDHKWMEHHLYVCYSDSLALKNHLLFRNKLREESRLFNAYYALKKSLALQTGITRETYNTGKTDFIISVLATAGLTEQELSKIKSVN